MIDPGKLRSKIKIQKKGSTTRGKDNSQSLADWSDWKPLIWVEIVSQNTKEYYKAMQIHADMDILFRTHFIPGLSRHMRVVFGVDDYGKDRIFSILGVQDANNMHIEHLITCKEVV